MKSVLISIQSKWCELIASGKKTVEVRKTRPKLETPFKVYIYMTKSNLTGDKKAYKDRMAGKVIGEFVCDWVESTPLWRIKGNTGFCAKRTNREEHLPQMACLSLEELEKYAGSVNRLIYGWHISNLVIYDEPKELSEFYHDCGEIPKCDGCKFHCVESNESVGYYEECCSLIEYCKQITRPPQSWCYVETTLNYYKIL